MGLIKNNELIADDYLYLPEDAPMPASGAVIVDLERWQSQKEQLIHSNADIGIRLKSDQSPELIADDLSHVALVALEFPAFRDGRAYSYARMLRERYGFSGEIRAVGDVLQEQLHFMLRTGFDAFEIESDDPLGQYRAALVDFSVWYQPTADGRQTAMQLRRERD